MVAAPVWSATTHLKGSAAMKIANDSVVSFHYRVGTVEGEPVDKSEKDEPLVYLHGSGQIVSGLEEALGGHEPGDHIDARITPEAGYGVYDERLDLKIPLKAFPDGARARLEPGFRFVASHPFEEEDEIMYTVVVVEEDGVLVTGNHPLAGKTLLFEVDIVAVRAATAEELSHGHVHGAGGAHH
jgi:FKBP-type peptidyl-prolyl cis-trans isomerase SlyD